MTEVTPLRKRIFEFVALNHTTGQCTGVQTVPAIGEAEARESFEVYTHGWDAGDDIEVLCRPFQRDPRSRG
jgi:hypothetical protein